MSIAHFQGNKERRERSTNITFLTLSFSVERGSKKYETREKDEKDIPFVRLTFLPPTLDTKLRRIVNKEITPSRCYLFNRSMRDRRCWARPFHAARVNLLLNILGKPSCLRDEHRVSRRQGVAKPDRETDVSNTVVTVIGLTWLRKLRYITMPLVPPHTT